MLAASRARSRRLAPAAAAQALYKLAPHLKQLRQASARAARQAAQAARQAQQSLDRAARQLAANIKRANAANLRAAKQARGAAAQAQAQQVRDAKQLAANIRRANAQNLKAARGQARARQQALAGRKGLAWQLAQRRQKAQKAAERGAARALSGRKDLAWGLAQSRLKTEKQQERERQRQVREQAKRAAGEVEGRRGADAAYAADLAGARQQAAATVGTAGGAGAMLAANNNFQALARVTDLLGDKFRVAGAAIRAFGEVTEAWAKRSKDLQQYSGELAGANIRAEVRSLVADIKESQALGGRLAQLTSAKSDLDIALRDALLPFKAILIDLLVPNVETLARFARGLGTAPDVLKRISDAADGVWKDIKAMNLSRFSPAALLALAGEIRDIVRDGMKKEPAEIDDRASDAALREMMEHFRYDESEVIRRTEQNKGGPW